EQGSGNREQPTALRGLAIAISEDARAISEELAADSDTDADTEPEPPPAETMYMFSAPPPFLATAPTPSSSDPCSLTPVPCSLGISIDGASAIEVFLDAPGLRAALEDATLPKLVHDLKSVLRALVPHNITLRGDVTDVMLKSYLINPTHASHTLADIAARSTNRALVYQPTKSNPADPNRLPEAAAAIVRLARVFADQMAESDAAASSVSTLGPVQSE